MLDQSYSQKLFNAELDRREAEKKLEALKAQIAKPTMTLSVSRKIPMEQYGAAEAFISIKDITEETTEAEIAILIEKGGIGWKAMTASLNEKIAEFRKGGI